MQEGEPKLEVYTPSSPERGKRPRLGQALAVCLLLGAAFVGCSAGPEMTVIHEPNSARSFRLMDADPKNTAPLGREVLDKVGYERLMGAAERAGFVTTKRVPKAPRRDGAALAMSGAVAMDEAMRVFTRRAVLAGITSQLDTPAPGPADVAALGILFIALVQAGAILAEGAMAESSSPPASATTAPPPAPPAPTATATSAPTATAVPTVTAPPVAGTRRNPGQTCDDARLDELQGRKNAACKAEWNCRDSSERLGRKNEKLFTCAEIEARIAAAQACITARMLVQSECFGGLPDARHAKAIAELSEGLKRCTAKLLTRGPGGGPCP